MYNQTSLIDAAISKYGGEDEAYKLKLKTSIRDGMGYSSYINKMNQAAGKPLSLNLKGNITPAGVKELARGAMNMQQEEVSTYGEMASRVDTVAGSLASAQASREKSARDKAYNLTGIQNGVMFNPQSEIEQQIADYERNPYHADGSVKSLQEFEAELNDYWSNPEKMQTGPKVLDANGNPVPYQVHTPEDIKSTIQRLVPKDYIGNEQMYTAMAMGYSRKQATDPSTSGAVRDAMQTEEREVVDPKTGQKTTEVIPKFTASEIQNKYPDLTPAEVKEIVKPSEQKSMVDDIVKDPLMESATKIMQTAVPSGKNIGQAYREIMDSEEYKALKTGLKFEYPNFTPAEIDSIIYNVLRSQ